MDGIGRVDDDDDDDAVVNVGWLGDGVGGGEMCEGRRFCHRQRRPWVTDGTIGINGGGEMTGWCYVHMSGGNGVNTFVTSRFFCPRDFPCR